MLVLYVEYGVPRYCGQRQLRGDHHVPGCAEPRHAVTAD